MAAENCLAPGATPSWGGPYPIMIECGGINAQISERHCTTLEEHSSLCGQPRLSLGSNPKSPFFSSESFLFPKLLQVLSPRSLFCKHPSYSALSDCFLRSTIYASLLLPCLKPCNGIFGVLLIQTDPSLATLPPQSC